MSIKYESKTDITEYFCKNCGQMRLSLHDDKTHCRNCGSKNIITGKVNELDKPVLVNTRLKENARKTIR